MLFNLLHITNKIKHFSFKSGCVVHVANNKICRQLQLKKTKVTLYKPLKQGIAANDVLSIENY